MENTAELVDTVLSYISSASGKARFLFLETGFLSFSSFCLFVSSVHSLLLFVPAVYC